MNDNDNYNEDDKGFEEFEEFEELEFNRVNREESEKIMNDGSYNRDGFWDSQNPAVKIVLTVLGAIILFGLIYYVIMFLNS